MVTVIAKLVKDQNYLLFDNLLHCLQRKWSISKRGLFIIILPLAIFLIALLDEVLLKADATTIKL